MVIKNNTMGTQCDLDNDDFMFNFVIKIPNLELTRGSIEELEIHMKDERSCIEELHKTVRGFLLSRVNEMYLGPQGFTLPTVGLMKWRKLNFLNDTPENNIQDINEMMDVIAGEAGLTSLIPFTISLPVKGYD